METFTASLRSWVLVACAALGCGNTDLSVHPHPTEPASGAIVATRNAIMRWDNDGYTGEMCIVVRDLTGNCFRHDGSSCGTGEVSSKGDPCAGEIVAEGRAFWEFHPPATGSVFTWQVRPAVCPAGGLRRDDIDYTWCSGMPSPWHFIIPSRASGEGAAAESTPAEGRHSVVLAQDVDIDGDGAQDRLQLVGDPLVGCYEVPRVKRVEGVERCPESDGGHCFNVYVPPSDFDQYTLTGAGDVDGDGRPDIAIAHRDHLYITHAQGEPDTGRLDFVVSEVYRDGVWGGLPSGSWRVLSGRDLDRDGRIDLLIATSQKILRCYGTPFSDRIPHAGEAPDSRPTFRCVSDRLPWAVGENRSRPVLTFAPARSEHEPQRVVLATPGTLWTLRVGRLPTTREPADWHWSSVGAASSGPDFDGRTLAVVTDADGDGHRDLALTVGPRPDNICVQVWSLEENQGRIVELGCGGPGFGQTIGGGDLNGDGYDDLVVGDGADMRVSYRDHQGRTLTDENPRPEPCRGCGSFAVLPGESSPWTIATWMEPDLPTGPGGVFTPPGPVAQPAEIAPIGPLVQADIIVSFGSAGTMAQ